MYPILRRSIGPLLSLSLFATAAWVLHRQLGAYRFHDLLGALNEFSAGKISAAALLTLLSYGRMTGYDALALRYIGHPLPARKTGLASFIGYAFSNNVGLSLIAGASVRFRLYSGWGLSTPEISRIVGFCTLTLWLGFLCLGGLLFVLEPFSVPEGFPLGTGALKAAGLGVLCLVGLYLLVGLRRKAPFHLGSWTFSLPSPKLLLPQVLLGGADWFLAGAVLYALLQPLQGWTLYGFMTVYMLAQLSGLLSQVPGGLGIFETVVFVLLAGRHPAPQVLAALMTYRILYYWIPLALAVLLLGIQEVLRHRRMAVKVVGVFEHWVSTVMPHVIAAGAFVSGAVLLFSGATPSVESRTHLLRAFVPLPLLELSHFLGSVAGMGLLLLGRGLQRRMDAAWAVSVLLLATGIAASLAKGLDYEEATLLLVILLGFLPTRRHFYRKSSLFSARFSVGWMVAIAVVVGTSLWLGLFAYHHLEYSSALWWQFTFSGNASRFLRASTGAMTLGLLYGLVRLIQPRVSFPEEPRPNDLSSALDIVKVSPDASAHLALVGDKNFLFSSSRRGLIMYGVQGRSWIAMGDPLGPAEEWAELIWSFHELADRYGGLTVFYEVGHARLHLYLDLGLSMVKIGEEARVPLPGFGLEGSGRKDLRYTVHKLERQGCRFDMMGPEEVEASLGELKEISDAWLAEKHTREKGFSLGFFSPGYLKRCPVAVARMDGSIVGFSNLWVGAGKHELSVDLMRYRPEAPHGVMEYLFIQIMLWGVREGYGWFNLGMVPFSGFEEHTLAPALTRLGAFVYRHGEHFYNFQGLRQFKEKFNPVWEPKYLASPGGFALPQVFVNLTGLISGGMKGLVAK